MNQASSGVVIVGAGIAGLSAAWELQKRGVTSCVLEAGPRPGGVVFTERFDGWTIDAGPDSLLVQKPAAVALCRELGIADRLHPTLLPRMAYVLREGRRQPISVKLAERPVRGGSDDDIDEPPAGRGAARPAPRPVDAPPALGVLVRELDPMFAGRLEIPDTIQGVIVSRVEPMSPAFDADIARGHVLLEINRQAVQGIEDYRRLTDSARPGDVLTLYLYKPELNQRALETVKIDER